MPGLSDLLRNPRRLQQWSETPGNYPAALDYARQGQPQSRMGYRTTSRASSAKKEPGTLETGEYIEQIELPSGELVKPATPSGRLVKAPGKSNLYLDPTTGEPYNADPSQPTGLRSAWNNARQVTKDGKVFKTISGVGEREIGVDPKVAEDATKAAAKREAENRRLAMAREKRPYNIDRVTGEPVPLQTDEEWAAAKQAKAAKLDESARVKRLKDQADVIDLEADRISLTAPKPAKEDEEAFNAAESALSQFAAGQDMEETAAKYAAAPATDEAGQQAKAAAENYLAYKDKVKPAKEAEKKVQELKLRALDIKEQIINPQKWKAGKTASLAALPDDDLVAEVKAQADIINEQEEQAVGTLDTITKGRNAIVAELNSFNEEFQSQAEQGLTAEEMAALDIQKARLEQSLADYDEHNGEAKAESDAALKAAADRRDVLAVAGTELEGRAAKQAEAAGQAKAKAETLAKAKPLYEGWAKGLYSDDWRTEEETPRLAQEAAKAGLDVASAKEALQTYRQLDWSNPRRDAKTGQPIAEEVRTLPDGNVTVNPTMWGDAEAYKKAVDASQGTPEGKAKALEAFPKLQEIHAEKAVEILSQSANIPGADNFMAWRERKIEEDQATQGKLGFARQSPAKQAIAYMEEMKNRSWFRKAGEQVGLGLLAGFQDIATQALGVGAMVTGSETLADLAAANTENTQSVVGAQNLEGSDTDYALRVMGMGARMTPAVAAMIAGAGAVGGGLGTAAVLAGGQTAGSMFADLYRTAKEDAGLSHGEAWRKAALPAALAGVISGLITKGMGPTGLERIFSDKAMQETARNTFKGLLGQFVKGAAEELPEEIADEYFTTILQESAASADPVATFKNFANTLPELAGVTALMGGAGALMQARRQAGTEGPGMAPPPEGEAPAMPVQPRPAGPAPTPAPETPTEQDPIEAAAVAGLVAPKRPNPIEAAAQAGLVAPIRPRPQDVAAAAEAGLTAPTAISKAIANQIAKFNPTGATPLPQSVAATAKRTGRPPAAVARQAAAGVVKIAQGQSLESLDIEEQEALGFVNKGGKITPDTKVTPLVYLYKDKPVLRNAAAEWLTDEAQEGLAAMVNLTEAERKAQIDAEEAKPAKKKAGQAKPAKAESTPQDSEVVITGGSLPSNTGANPVPATIQTPEPAPANEQDITPNADTQVGEAGPTEDGRQSQGGISSLETAPPQEAPPEPAPTGLSPAQEARATPEQKARAAKKAGKAKPPAAPVDQAAGQAATSSNNTLPEPTEAQKDAGNYQKGHTTIAGLNISIENAAGTKRRPEWGNLADHYGYIKGSIDNTGEQADVFIKPGTPKDYAGPVFVVTQNDPKTGKFDEFKSIIGYATPAEAEAAYRSNYTPDWKGFGGIQQMSLDEFKAGLADMTVQEKAQTQSRPQGGQTEEAGVSNVAPGEGSISPATATSLPQEPAQASQKEASQLVPAAKPPEQMTPEEYVEAKKPELEDVAVLEREFNDLPKDSNRRPRAERAIRSAREDNKAKEQRWKEDKGMWDRKHRRFIGDATEAQKPVSASAVDAYGIKLPEGYTREGDLYVYRPAPSPAPASQPAGQAEAALEVGTFVRANGKGPVFKIESIGADGWVYLANGQGSYSPEDAAKTLVSSTEDAAAKEAVKGGFPGFDSQPAQPPRPATPEGRAEAAITEYVESVRSGLTDPETKSITQRKLELSKRLSARLKTMSGAVDFDVYKPELSEEKGELMIEVAAGRRSGILFVNPEKLINRLAKDYPNTNEARAVMDKWILHEFVHLGALAKMNASKIEGLYNALTPEAKEASRKLYFKGAKDKDTGKELQFADNFQAAHEWFAQQVEALMRGEIANSADIKGISDPTLRESMMALLRDFVAQLREIADLVQGKNAKLAAEIRAEAEAVAKLAADMAAKAGLEIQAGPEAAPQAPAKPATPADVIRQHLDDDDAASALAVFNSMTKEEINKTAQAVFGRGFYNNTKAEMLAALSQWLPDSTKSVMQRLAKQSAIASAKRALKTAKENQARHAEGILGMPTTDQAFKNISEAEGKDPHGIGKEAVAKAWQKEVDDAQAKLDELEGQPAQPAPQAEPAQASQAPVAGTPMGQAAAAATITKGQAEGVLKDSTLKDRPIKTYEMAVAANQVHMGTKISDWSAFPFTGEAQDGRPTQNLAGASEMQKAPTLFPNSNAQEHGNCEWCGKQPVKNFYFIKDDGKKWTLAVGSECITHFADKSGDEMAGEARQSLALATIQGITEARKTLSKEFSEIQPAGYGRTERVWRSPPARTLTDEAPDILGKITIESGAAAHSRWLNTKLEAAREWLARYAELMARPETKKRQIEWRSRRIKEIETTLKLKNKPEWELASLEKKLEELRGEKAAMEGTTATPPPAVPTAADEIAARQRVEAARIKADNATAKREAAEATLAEEAPALPASVTPVQAEAVAEEAAMPYASPLAQFVGEWLGMNASQQSRVDMPQRVIRLAVNQADTEAVMQLVQDVGTKSADGQLLFNTPHQKIYNELREALRYTLRKGMGTEKDKVSTQLAALPDLTPPQTAAVAKEVAMPEPAKQAAPFDAAAAKGQKKFLLAEVAAAVKAAPKRADMTQEQKDAITNLEDKFRNWDSLNEEERKTYASELAAAKADAERLIGYVTIEVPGDGTFTILNEKEALYRFQKKADKFPVSQAKDDLPAKPTAQAPTAVPALKKAKTTADVVAAVFPMVSTDATRPALQKVKGDGTYLWATNGRFAVRVEQENGGGKGLEAIVYDEKGNAQPWPEGPPPPAIAQVFPDDKAFTPYTLDTARWFSLMSQARAVIKDLPGEDESKFKSVSLYRNPDGSLGLFASDVNRGDYAHNIQPKAKILAAYSPDYFQTILRVARNLGNEQIELRIGDDVSPATLRAGKALFVLMPMRVNGAPAYAPQAARPAPPVTAEASPAAEPPAQPGQTREEAAEAARAIAAQDPSIPPPAPDDLETLQALRDRANRKPYSSDKLTPARLAVGIRAGWVTKTKEAKLTEKGSSQLSEWQQQQSAHDSALGALSDKLVDEAVSKWDRENDPTSWEAINAAKQAAAQPGQEAAQPAQAPAPEGQGGAAQAEAEAAPVIPPAKRTKKTIAKIEDVGEKIGGARKDRWKERGLAMSDYDGLTDTEKQAYTNKAQVFPKPDYQALIESGVEKPMAYALKEVYDSIAPKPNLNRAQQADPAQRDAALRLYVETVGKIRDGLKSVKTPEELKALRDAVFESSPTGYGGRSQYTADAKAIMHLVSTGKRSYELPGAMEVTGYDLRNIARKLEKLPAWPAPQEQWQRMFDIRMVPVGSVISNRLSDGTWEKKTITVNTPPNWQVIKGGHYIVSQDHPTKEAAEAWAKAAAVKARKEDPKRPFNPDVKRTGPDYRNGRDVTGDELLSEFGFRGAEFGLWTNDGDRQQSLNQAFDGLHDLARILNVSPKALSLNGELGIAFGARGSGKFAAHYEPSRVVINLTKTSGAGALAHEWAHAMDDYFGRLATGGQIGKYVSHGAKGTNEFRAELAATINEVLKAVSERQWTAPEYIADLKERNATAQKKTDSWLKSVERSTEKVKLTPTQKDEVDTYISQLRGQRMPEALANGRPDMTQIAVKMLAIIDSAAKAQKIRIDWPVTGGGKMSDLAAGLGRHSGMIFATNNDLARAEAGNIQVPARTVPTNTLKASQEQGDYWQRKHELFARSFEAFIEDSIRREGNQSPYLVGFTADSGSWGNLYPQGDERTATNEAFQKMVDAIKTRETDKGVALYNPPSQPAVLGLPPAGQAVTPAQDAEYLAAVAAGDMEKAQRMVDEAAKSAGYDNPKVFRAETDDFDRYDMTIKKRGQSEEGVIFWTTNELVADSYMQDAKRKVSAYLKYNDPMVFDAGGSVKDRSFSKWVGWAQEDGNDAIVIRNVIDPLRLPWDKGNTGNELKGTLVGVFTPSQIKSADPVTRDESGEVIPLSERFNQQSNSILRNPPAPEGGPAASQEASQPEADEEADPDLAAFMAEQQRLAEEEAAAREALRNDPDAIDAMQASGKMSARNLSKQFEYPEARAVYQALTAARDELGGPETVQLDKLRKWAKETFESDPEKYVQWAADMAEESKLLDVDEQAVLGQAFQFLTREARLTGDKNIRALLNKVGNYYLDTGTRLAQAMSARRDPLESPQERWTKALDIVFGPSEAVRRKLRILPTQAGKARRIASLEAQLAEVQGSRRADIEAALKTARAQETQEELLAKDDAESEKIKKAVLKNMGVTEDDLMLSGTDRVALQSAILDLPAVKEGLEAYKGKDNDGYNIMRLAFRGFSDAHIANALNLNQDDVGKFIHDATAAIIRPAVAAQVKVGTGFGGLIKAGFAKLKKAVGLGLPPSQDGGLAALDKEYMDAVQAGDMAKAQRLVIDSARTGTPVTRHIETPTNTPLENTYQVDVNGLIYRTVTENDWQRIQDQGFIDSDQRMAISSKEGVNLALSPLSSVDYAEKGENSVLLVIKPSDLRLHGYDMDQYIRTWDRIPLENIIDTGKFIGKETLPRQFDPVTHDESGKVIPLSQRFNPGSDSILRLPPKAIEAQPALLGGKRQTVADVTAEVNRVMAYALQSAKARNSGKLMSKVVMTPGGQRVRVFVPFDPDDMASYYAFAREYTAAKASAFDKVYEYWINWPLLSGPQTQVANITGNAAQVAWHYTGQRFAEATLNLAYQDPNAPQFREFKHVLKGFWQGIGPAFEMARETFLTEGDTIRHKYLGQPLEIDVVDGDLDKVGNIRASVGGQVGRISRLPGRVLRFTDAFFKTAIMYAEASAVAYRRAHVEAKRQGLKGQARAAFIDTEIANTLNDTSSAVWGEVMKTAEELLFQDDNSATEIVDTVLGGYKGIKDLEKLLAEAEAKGDSDLAAKLQKRIRSRKFVGSLMRWIFPFQRTPTNIVRAGIKKAGGSAISLLYGLTRAGWLAMGKDGVPVIKSYPKAMQIKDASETLLAGLGWLALASMLEGDDNDDEKPVLLVGTRSHSLKERAATDQFLRKYGGENSIVWQDGKGKVLGSLPFGRYEPAATTLTTWIDAYRNYQEVKRLKSQGENASYTTYMLSSLVSSLEDKSFLQGFANAMQFVRDVEEKRENPDQNAGVKMLMNNVIPNLIKQPLRNMDDVLRERTTAGPGYAALPNPTIAPKLPVFAAQPKISTTGERLTKAFTPPARLLFQANTKVTPQPDALLYRANRLHPTKRWSPQPLQRDDYNADPPGKAKPVPITDPAKKRQFAELAGRLYAANAAKVAAKAMPSEKAAPGESLIKAFKKAREDAMAAARAQAHAMGLHKATATP